MLARSKLYLPKTTILMLSLIPLLLILVLTVYKIFNKLNVDLECKDCNVILVLLDTLGTNHLPCYGYERDTAPILCAFAKENVMFQNAYSNATWTLPSHVSAFTGLYPETHNVIQFGVKLDSNQPFLPEILKENGYNTIFVMPTENSSFPTKDVYYRGIDKIIGEPPEMAWENALKIFDENIKENKKTFLFLHTYYVHSPYIPKESDLAYTSLKIEGIPLSYSEIFDVFSDDFITYLTKQLRDDIENGVLKDEIYLEIDKFLEQNKGNFKTVRDYLTKNYQKYGDALENYSYQYNWERKIDTNNPSHIEYIRALYDQKILEMDKTKLKTLLTYLDNKEVSNKTILIIMADHGEEFMEHNQIMHKTIYEPNIKVPLIMKIPKLESKNIQTPVQIVDVTPTILELVGINTTFKFQGQSLVSTLKGKKINDRILVTNGESLTSKALRLNEWKLLLHKINGSFMAYELYDTNSDPLEQNNVLFSNSEIADNIISKYNNTIKNKNKVDN